MDHKTENITKQKPWVIVLLSLCIAGCANIVTPTGGPKDTTPPRIVNEMPPNGKTNFTDNSIRIWFDEYIALKNPQANILISPIPSEKPEYRLKGKSLIIRFADSLLPNTTYSIFLGNAVADITEGNLVPNYTYVFSSGTFLDSLAVEGRVFNGYDLSIPENTYVMLYPAGSDSLIIKEAPRYITKANNNGTYNIKNIAEGTYQLIALQDMNKNFRYDPADEAIAFLDTSINIMPPFTVDKDTISTDSIITTIKSDIKQYVLPLSLTEDSIQRVLEAKNIGKERVRFIFRYPIDSYSIATTNDTLEDQIIWELVETRDTLTGWLPLHNADSLTLFFNETSLTDTFFIALREPFGLKGRTTKPTPWYDLSVKKNAKLRPGKPLYLICSEPVDKYDFANTLLIKDDKDTIPVDIILSDSVTMRRFLVSADFEHGAAYALSVPANSFRSIRTYWNDTIKYPFKMADPDEYGKLILQLNYEHTDSGNLMIQLFNSAGKIIDTKLPDKESMIVFDQILPGKYRIKATLDRNKNMQWDAGNYWKRRQPEKVTFMPAEISIRANWEEETMWEIRFTGYQ